MIRLVKHTLLYSLLTLFAITAWAQDPVRHPSRPVVTIIEEKCKVCGKELSNCPYHGKHPKCKYCGKYLSQCPFHGLRHETLNFSENIDTIIRLDSAVHWKIEKHKAKWLTIYPTGYKLDEFVSAVEASNIADKDLVLRVLSMYADDEIYSAMDGLSMAYPSITKALVDAKKKTPSYRIIACKNKAKSTRQADVVIKTENDSRGIQIKQAPCHCEASAHVDSIRVDRNYISNGVSFSKVHVDFSIENMGDSSVSVLLWVFDNNGDYQKHENIDGKYSKYLTNENLLCYSQHYTLTSDDFHGECELYMPNALISTGGKFVVQIKGNDIWLALSKFIPIPLSK